MKKLTVLLCSLVVLVNSSYYSSAQDLSKKEIASVIEKGKTVSFSISCSKPFIFANNRYYLNIGGKKFSQYQQNKVNGHGLLTFIIGVNDFKKIKEGDAIYLTYGKADEDEDLEELSKREFPTCWSLGKFSSALITK